MYNSMLYPRATVSRASCLLDGIWGFQFDPKSEGEENHWEKGLPDAISMPVPSSFSDLFTDKESRDYCGDFWYETSFFLPPHSEGLRQVIRFASVTHRAVVYCNGVEVARHEGGFLPFSADVTGIAKQGEENRLLVKVNNELSEKAMPCGTVKIERDGSKVNKPYFDFYNYSGIQRSVRLLLLPMELIEDYSVTYELSGENALVHYTVQTNGDHPVKVTLKDANGTIVAESTGKEGTLFVEKARLWKVRDAYLYTITITIEDENGVIDQYFDRIGIRTVAIENARFLINGEPVYLKGFGKHEDFEVIGRGFNASVMKRDFACMKWMGANCFRTSHYPYAEEWYQMADEEGFLIIDEVPGVGMMRSLANYVDAGSGKYTYFFETPTVPILRASHIQQTQEMIRRDKNHPCVFAWSLFNEPETISSYAADYFGEIFAAARALDPQKRPCTGALEKTSSPQECQCYPLCDFICLNRYYGWYILGGELEEAREEFIEEMDAWADKKLNKPFVFTEFGTDTLASEHKLPSVMWTQEYQNEYLNMNFEVFARYDFVQGELVWNFADFQTSEGIMRVNGNKKGIFTRNRQPKDAAFLFKKRWEEDLK